MRTNKLCIAPSEQPKDALHRDIIFNTFVLPTVFAITNNKVAVCNTEEVMQHVTL